MPNQADKQSGVGSLGISFSLMIQADVSDDLSKLLLIELILKANSMNKNNKASLCSVSSVFAGLNLYFS
jgi:hypothetical protein